MVYLPSELVREIIELAVPGSFHSTTYRDRLSTLAPLCLVSHQFHAIAQPLLDEIVIFSYDDKIETFPIASMRHVIFDRVAYYPFERALERSHSLRSVTLRTNNGCAPPRLAALWSHSTLESLCLRGSNLDARDCEHASMIQSLDVDGQAFLSIGNLLDPRSLPSLKVLGLFAFDNTSMCRRADESFGLRSLMPQLDAFVVQCHLYDMGCFPDIDPSRILVDTFVEAVGTARMAIQHVRFTASWWSRDRTIRAEGLALTLTSRPRFRKLETVYLDSEQFSDLDLTLFKAAVHRECPSMSFEVVIEPQARTVSSLNSSISQDFVSRMRKKKSRNTVNGSGQP